MERTTRTVLIRRNMRRARRAIWYSMSTCFFFSSRRRHTRFDCDWSSDVCSSDLIDRAKQALTKLSKTPKTEAAFWIEDADKIGNYHSVLEKLAKAGINIEATDAFGIGGEFAPLIFYAGGGGAKTAKQPRRCPNPFCWLVLARSSQ